jgi:8-oxo-dGTP pyrophosphatase MutT (NUDIX family)
MELPMTAEIHDGTIVHQGKVFTLVRENVTLENGTTTDMEFIEHPGAAAIIPMLSDTRVVLLKQYRHALKNYIWEIPAGTLDPQEEIIDCARRELTEETGFSAAQWHRLGEITPVPGYSDERIHIFLATDLQPAERHPDADEVIEVRKVDFFKALEMIGDGQIQDAKSIAGLFLASAWLKGNT